MSHFSTYLKKLITNSGESISSIARSINVERTSIHKAISGDRTLPYTAVRALAIHFNLTLDERQEFFRLYDLELLGEERYENRKAVCDLLNNLSSLSFTMPPLPEVSSIPEIPQLIHGEYTIHSLIRSIMIYETEHNEDPQFQMFIPEKLNITMELMELWLNDRHFHVTELLHLQSMHSHTDEYKRKNLKKLASIIPLCLVSRGHYESYYFTEAVETLTVSPMCYYIITPHYLIQMSKNLTVAKVSTHMDTVNYYHNWFNALIQNFEPLTQYSSNILEVLQEYIKGTSSDSLQIIMSQPCVGRYITKDIIKKYLVNDDMPYEDMYQLVENHFSVLRNIENHYVTIFDEKGLEDITKNYILQDLPPQYVPPLEKSDIKVMLQSLYSEIEKGNVSGIIARPTHLRIPHYLSLYVNSQTGLHIYTTNAFVFGAYCCDIHIKEPSICSIFDDFVQCLPGSPMVYSKEETLNLIKQSINNI